MQRPLPTPYRYLRLRVDPTPPAAAAAAAPDGVDALTVRRAIQDALAQSFGAAAAHTYVDVLHTAPGDPGEVMVRVDSSAAPQLLAALTASAAAPRLALVKESGFLPALLSTGDDVL